MKIEYRSNNSGGSWWLEEADWKALEAAGWDVEWIDGDWLGAPAKVATKDFECEADAVGEWQDITKQNADEEGCNCCGQPHWFSEAE